MTYESALILEGGAMRGVYVSGVLDYFMDKGLDFGAVYGVSAGAKNSQYYPTHQRGEAIKVDYYCAKNKKCINPLNMFFKGGIIDKDYYNNYIMKHIAPLDEEAFFSSPMRYYIGTTNCRTGEPTFFEKSTLSDLRKTICASCSMQVLQDMVEIDGDLYLDGGASECVAIYEAIKNKEKKMVLVLTRAKGYRVKPQSRKLNKLFEVKYRNYPELVKHLLSSADDYNKCMDLIDELEEKGEIFVIRPKMPPVVKRLERSVERLRGLYVEGYSEARESYNDLIAFLEK